MLKTSKLTEKLKANFFFKKAPNAAVTAGLRKESLKEIPEGDIIYQNGNPSDSVYLILYGLVKIKIKTKTGAKIITKAAGDFFGEREVMESQERSSTAIAEMNTELFLIDKSTFLNLAYNDKEIKINVKINLAKTYDLSKEGAEAILAKNDPAHKSGAILSPGVVSESLTNKAKSEPDVLPVEEEPEEVFDDGFSVVDDEIEPVEKFPAEELEDEEEIEESPAEEFEEEEEIEESPVEEFEDEEDIEEFSDEELEEEDEIEEFPDEEFEDEEEVEEFPDEEFEDEEDIEESPEEEENTEGELPEFNFDDSFEESDPEFESEATEFSEAWMEDDEFDSISDREREEFGSTTEETESVEELNDEESTPVSIGDDDIESEEEESVDEIVSQNEVAEFDDFDFDEKTGSDLKDVPVVSQKQDEENRAKIEALTKSINLISGVCRANTPRDIYDALKEDIAGFIDATEFMMFVFDGGFLASVGEHLDEGTNFAIREKIAYELITMHEPVTLFDLDSSGIMDGMEHVVEDQIPTSLLYYPLIERDKRVIGCFLFFTSKNGRFSHSDVMVIEDFAKSASGILEKISVGQTPVTYKYEDLEKYTAFFGSEIKMAVETILSVSETLDRGKLSEKVRYGFDIIRERASGLKGFLDSIQYFLGKLSGFSKQPYLVSELLDDFLVKISESAKQREVTLLRKYDSDVVMFFNRELFIHALSLVTQNSFDAMPNGGKIYFSTSANESNILISIRDTGSGVHPDLREKIFEPFFSVGKTGVGLGLPIANKIIKEHGGYIYLESSRTQGTEIIIALPV